METNKVVDLGTFEDATLDVLVENMGRVNYAEFKSPVLNSQRKGIQSMIYINGYFNLQFVVSAAKILYFH